MGAGSIRSLDGRFGPPLVALLVAVPLLWLSLPRLAAEFAALPGSFHLRDVSFGRAVPAPVLELLGESQLRALEFVDSPRYWENLALVEVQRAQTAGYTTPQGRRHLREALRATRESLARSPLQMRAWLRLSHTLVALYGPLEEAADALVISLLTGPNEDYLLEARFVLISRLWSLMDEEGRKQAVEVMRKHGPARLASLAIRFGEGMDTLREAFAEDAEFLDLLERMHENRRQRIEEWRQQQLLQQQRQQQRQQPVQP